MAKVYRGTILGREDFIDGVLKKVTVENRSTAEISYRKCLRAVVLPGQIIAAAPRYCGISEAEALCGECRKVCLYFLKRWTSAKNAEIGERLGGMGMAAVAKGYQRFVQKLEKDEEMKNKSELIELEMSRVRG
jgi:chromosomal replication initiation ATPase DnaA